MRKPCKTKALYITNLGLLDNLAQTQVVPYLAGLAKMGVEITILSFEKKENLKNFLKTENIEKRLHALGIKWHYLIYHNRWGNILDVFLGLAKAFQLVRAGDIALLHARASIPILIAWPVAKILKRKIIYDRRGTMAGDFVDDVNVKNMFSLKLFSNMLDRIDNFLMRHSDATIVLSRRARKMLEEDRYVSAGGGIIAYIPCCVDTGLFDNAERGESFKVNNLDGRFVISYLGSLGTCYLLKEMAMFFKAFKKTMKNALFLIISHTGKDFIEDVLKKEGLKRDHDYMIVSVEPKEVPGYLSKANCSIMFIKPVLCKVGASPTKFAESLAAGVPVCINRNIGDIDEFIEREKIGVTVDRLDETSYQASIEKLKDLFLDKGLSHRCRQVAADAFSSKEGIDRYYKVYENTSKKGEI